MYQNLKDYTYYEELYDKLTIEECKRWESGSFLKDTSKLKGKEKKIAELKNKTFRNLIAPMSLIFLKAGRASEKSETIQKWMERDRAKDEKVTNAREPEGVRCLGCSSRLKKCISRDLMDNHQGKEEVLFMLECDKCEKRRAYWESGKEWEYAPTCEKCKTEVQIKRTRNDNVITSEYACPNCGHTEIDTLELNKNDDEVDPNFEVDRKNYCMSESEGNKLLMQTEGARKLVDDWEERDKNKELYEAANNIKKLTISELQNLLNPVIEKAGYAKLEFEKPEIQKNVIMEFSLQDIKFGRNDRNSVYDLERLLRKTLEGTNWSLMGDGASYRLGFITGRLKGFESEEDILKLVKDIRNKK